MTLPTFESFASQAKSQGFDEVVERRWEPSLVLETHRHPFAVRALVVQGEMWLTVGDDVRRLVPGDTFALERDCPHAERYGADNAYELWASFVHFLTLRYGWEKLDALYVSGRGRAPGSANYERVLGKSLDELADEWRDWINDE